MNTYRTGNWGGDDSPGLFLVTGYEHTLRAGAVAFLSLCLAAGCTSTPLIEDGSAAAAAAVAAPGDATIVGESTAPSVSIAAPSLPALHELLAQERFVPLAAALERSGLDEVIDGLDDFVLLAPTGTAFASAGADIGIDDATLMGNPQLLEAIIRYHIVADPTTNQSWRTLNGAALDVRGFDPVEIERVDGVEVLHQIPVRNGTVLVMPRLLLPASGTVGLGNEPQRED